MSRKFVLLLTTLSLSLGFLLVFSVFSHKLFGASGLTDRKTKSSSRLLDSRRSSWSDGLQGRSTQSRDSKRQSSIDESEDVLIKKIVINGDEIEERSMNHVLAWVSKSQILPYKILGLSVSDRQKCEIINHYLDFVFSGSEFEPVMKSLVFIKSDLLRLSAKSKISAAAVRKGNIEWALSELNVATKGPERNSQLRAIIDHAAASDLNNVMLLLKNLKDPIEIREAQLSFSKWFVPKIDDKHISDIKPEDIGHDFYPLIKKLDQ
jgi:hypothetical protein